jgi:hypothetical protein
MIAVCPTCHDAIHHGDIPITDETLCDWKSIPRASDLIRNHIYVEPGPRPRILVGSITLTGLDGLVVFRLGASQELSFRTSGADLLLLNLRITDVAGTDVLVIRDNYVVHKPRVEIDYANVPGRMEVTAPADPSFVPEWALSKMRLHSPCFGQNGRVVLASVHVLEPGLVRVQGIWMNSNAGVIITDDHLSLLLERLAQPVSIVGAGKETTIEWRGAITTALFAFMGQPVLP